MKILSWPIANVHKNNFYTGTSSRTEPTCFERQSEWRLSGYSLRTAGQDALTAISTQQVKYGTLSSRSPYQPSYLGSEQFRNASFILKQRNKERRWLTIAFLNFSLLHFPSSSTTPLDISLPRFSRKYNTIHRMNVSLVMYQPPQFTRVEMHSGSLKQS